MRLTYVLERYPELSQTFVEDELRALPDEVTVLALQAGSTLAEAQFEAVYPPGPAARLAALARNPRLVRLTRNWPSDGRRLRGAARIAPWLARTGDHVHAHFATEAADIAELLARATGRTHSFTGHSTDLFADPEALRRRLDAAAFAVVVCEYDRREVERLTGRPVEVIPLGVDLDRLTRSTPYNPDGPIVAVARLVEHKGLADLVAAAGTLGREVVIAGDGPLRDSLRGAADMRGALSPRDARALIESASLLVAPSVIARDGSRDGIPMVIKEALALEVPVVASDAVGQPEVVEPAWGALYQAGDRSKLAAAIAAMLDRPDREAMGRAGRVFAERNCDVRRQTAKLRELFAASGTPDGGSNVRSTLSG